MYEYVYAETEREKKLRSLMFCLQKETAGEEEETSSNNVLCTSCGKYRDCADCYFGAKRLCYNSGSVMTIMVGIKSALTGYHLRICKCEGG